MSVLRIVSMAFAVFSVHAFGQTSPVEYVYQTSPEGLTEAKVLEVESTSLNPHRRGYLLTRKTEATEWKVHPMDQDIGRANGQHGQQGGGGYGVSVPGLRTVVTAFFRQNPGWYSEFKLFPCTKKPMAHFITREGASVSAQEGAERWRKLLLSRKPELDQKLKQATSSTPVLAQRLGEEVLKSWLEDVNQDWVRANARISKELEWKVYESRAQSERICSKKVSRHLETFVWDQRIGSPEKNRPQYAPLFRSPAKRWNGAYSARVVLKAAGKILNGQFLLDPSLPFTMISPNWLEAQGVYPYWIVQAGAKPAQIEWGSQSIGVIPAQVTSMTMGDYELPFKSIYIAQTERFEPPNHYVSCCDGVLGLDFFLRYAVVFSPGDPVHITVWDRNHIFPPRKFETSWEVAVDPRGALVSQCLVHRRRGVSYESIEWNFSGNPSEKGAPGKESALIRCGLEGRDGATSWIVPENWFKASETQSIGWRVMDQTDVALDLSNGRMWKFEEANKRDWVINRSPLSLKFDYFKGDRILQVTRTSDRLKGMGLAEGARILELGGFKTTKLDIWDVERALSGAYGRPLEVKWQIAGQKKIRSAQIRID